MYLPDYHVCVLNVVQRSPDCDMALVHDGDLVRLDGSVRVFLSVAPFLSILVSGHIQLDNVLGHLRKMSPEIHRVECGKYMISSYFRPLLC